MTPMQPYPRRWQALSVLAMSLLVVTVGNTILNVGLPTIRDGARRQLEPAAVDRRQLPARLRRPAARRRQPRRPLRAQAGALHRAGHLRRSARCFAALSDDATELIASRALMGLGAAAIMPTTLSILTNIFPTNERPKAIATWAAVSGLGIAIGPISGGFLIEHFAWSSIFLVNLPVVAALPDRRDPARAGVARPRVTHASTSRASASRSPASAPSSGP